MSEITLYCNCHGNKTSKREQFNQKNLMCGSYVIPQDQRNINFLYDDTGDNISNLNKYFGELSGLYWVWKNTQDELVGTNQYRIFWNDEKLKKVNFDEKTLVVVEQIDVNKYTRGNPSKPLSTYDHYSYCHGETSLILLQGMCKHNINSKLKPYMIDDLKTISYFSPSNMFIANRVLFNKVCEVLFEILFEYNERFSYLFPLIDQKYGHMRIVDYLAERIFHIICANKNYFFGNINIVEIDMIEYPHGEST